MSTTGIIILVVVVVVVVALVALLIWQRLRRRMLQQRFGPEYTRAVSAQPTRAAAEHELRAREERHAALDLKDLSPERQQLYAQHWVGVQSEFVDDPNHAVTDADALITNVMRERGYPTGDFDDRIERLSVEHARTLDHYRAAHTISLANQRGEASTEQLRQALVHYRALASDLLDPATEPSHDLSDTSTARKDTR